MIKGGANIPRLRCQVSHSNIAPNTSLNPDAPNSGTPVSSGVEAVEKVQTEWFCSVNAKIDLAECARFDASTRGRGKRTPENKSIPASRTFSTASLERKVPLVTAAAHEYVLRI